MGFLAAAAVLGLSLKGRAAAAMKSGRDVGGSAARGPRSKAKRSSLKVASQVMKKAVTAVMKAELK